MRKKIIFLPLLFDFPWNWFFQVSTGSFFIALFDIFIGEWKVAHIFHKTHKIFAHFYYIPYFFSTLVTCLREIYFWGCYMYFGCAVDGTIYMVWTNKYFSIQNAEMHLLSCPNIIFCCNYLMGNFVWIFRESKWEDFLNHFFSLYPHCFCIICILHVMLSKDDIFVCVNELSWIEWLIEVLCKFSVNVSSS